MSESTIATCSICRREYVGFGNNAQPLNEGRCCDDCNNKVIVARMALMQAWNGDDDV